ncbi:MAG TPA: phage terminase large subunit [Bacillota bacterium]|nr:phage terminase large subunit [Bacillota bacterium]
MAWINGTWLKRTERETIIQNLQELIDTMIAQPSLSEDELLELDGYLTEIERLNRIHRGEVDLLYFAHEYFGDIYNPDNDGNWIPSAIEDAPEFHHDLCNIINVISNEKLNEKIAWAAPRGHAKSSYLSKVLPIHEVVYRKRRYIMIVSETPDVSSANIDWISIQLKSNEKLRNDFGPLLSPKKQMNPKDNSSEFIAWEPIGEDGQKLLTKVEAASTGQALRGRNWNAVRPDLVICDDLEGKKNTNTPELRKELKDWFTQVLMPIGDPAGKKTAYVYMGTMVCFDSLLQYVMRTRSDFKSRLFQAIKKFPDRMDLWEECRLIYQDKENRNCAEDARAFYEERREEMDAGVVVLWPTVKSIWDLMTWKWDNGSKAFNTEMQNDPIDEETQVFVPERFFYWSDADPDRQFPHEDYEIYFGIDFAMGKKRGDFSAIVVIAKCKKTGIVYIIDTFIERVHPDKFLEVIVDKVIQWQPDGIAAEAQMAQEFFVHKLKQALEARGYPASTRVHEVHQRARKEIRIESMLPEIEKGDIRFSRRHYQLLEMFERYGAGYHDDGPDALEMAKSLCKVSQQVGFSLGVDLDSFFDDYGDNDWLNEPGVNGTFSKLYGY